MQAGTDEFWEHGGRTSWSQQCRQMEEDCSTRWDRRQRKPVFRTGSKFSVSRLLWSLWSGAADKSRLSWTQLIIYCKKLRYCHCVKCVQRSTITDIK